MTKERKEKENKPKTTHTLLFFLFPLSVFFFTSQRNFQESSFRGLKTQPHPSGMGVVTRPCTTRDLFLEECAGPTRTPGPSPRQFSFAGTQCHRTPGYRPSLNSFHRECDNLTHLILQKNYFFFIRIIYRSFKLPKYFQISLMIDENHDKMFSFL